MKKIKIYIVTYKRSKVLNDTLEKLFNSDFQSVENTEVNIINNHTEFRLEDCFKKKVNVLHNVLRPDWSNEKLCENWNQALINGFKNLNNPDAKYVITLQNDTSLHPKWCKHLFKMHKKYNFVVGKYGDNIVSYTPDAVKKIGIWDENFGGSGIKEADYWLRALIHNKDKSCINDIGHGMVLNGQDALDLDVETDRNFINEYDENLKEVVIKRKADDDEHAKIWADGRGGIYKQASWEYFRYKWSGTWKEEPQRIGWVKNWRKDFIKNPPDIKKSRVKMFMRYVYFENDIENLEDKNYLKQIQAT
jgi:hypothetical protein